MCDDSDAWSGGCGAQARMFALLVTVQKLSAGFCSPITLEDPVSGYNSAVSQDCQVWSVR